MSDLNCDLIPPDFEVVTAIIISASGLIACTIFIVNFYVDYETIVGDGKYRNVQKLMYLCYVKLNWVICLFDICYNGANRSRWINCNVTIFILFPYRYLLKTIFLDLLKSSILCFLVLDPTIVNGSLWKYKTIFFPTFPLKKSR